MLNDQRLVSLDTLFGLSDGLSDMAHGKPANLQLLGLAEELRDFELPRQIFSKSEKVEWAPRANSDVYKRQANRCTRHWRRGFDRC